MIQVGTSLVVLSLVYSHTSELHGWSESELLSLLGVQILLGGVIHAFIQPNTEKLLEDVQQGTLDYALTKPEDSQVLELFEGIYQTGRWPVGVYPGWLRYAVTFLVPVAFAVTVPAEAVTFRLGWSTLVLAVGFAAALFGFARWFWRFGLRRYSGASA